MNTPTFHISSEAWSSITDFDSEVELNKPFRKGCIDYFELESVDLGNLNKIKIRVQKDPQDLWFPLSIKIINTVAGKVWNLLTDSEIGPESVELDLATDD